jgi:ketosteroid isomerase-like protein
VGKKIDVVQQIYASFLAGDIPAILDRLDNDVVWEHDVVDHGIPWLKPRRGKQDVAQFFADLSALDIQVFEPLEFMESDRHVATNFRVRMVVRATGRAISDYELHLWTFDDAGAITGLRHFVDTRQHYLALNGHD